MQPVTLPNCVVDSREQIALGPWSCCAHPPGSIAHPKLLDDTDSRWMRAVVPGTVASTLQVSGQWTLGQPLDTDASDWWYRTTIDAHDLEHACNLVFEGLATRAEIWLNGKHLLTTDNMFRRYRLDVTPHLKAHNELAIVFRSLTADLGKKRPRPRWKTNLVNHQQLRWQRTSLLGRISGWTPSVAPVGPWRAVRVETGRVTLQEAHVVTSLDGATGVVWLHAKVHSKGP